MHGPRPNGAEAVPLTYLKAGSFAGFSLSTLHHGEKAFFWWPWHVAACGRGAGEESPARGKCCRPHPETKTVPYLTRHRRFQACRPQILSSGPPHKKTLK